MSKKIKISLSESEINNLINKLTDLQKSIKKLPEVVTKEVAIKGTERLKEYYANTPYSPNNNDINVKYIRTQLGYKIVSEGTDVIYAEFGTGDEGEKSPHNEKSKYNLNDYNSGKYIRDVSSLSLEKQQYLARNGISGGKYWTYKDGNTIYYTQGIPAGKQMFNTSNDLRSKIIPSILKEKGDDILSKL